jgi:hypothetical protein
MTLSKRAKRHGLKSIQGITIGRARARRNITIATKIKTNPIINFSELALNLFV